MSTTSMTPVTAPVLEPTSPPAPADDSGASCLSRIYRLTVEQYDRMVEANILGPDEKVELIEGILVTKVGRNRPHVQVGNKGFRALSRLVGGGWHVRKEDPAVVSVLSKPEPDLAVVRGTIEDYDHRDVTAADMALAAEISESTLYTDQKEKKPLYAASGIPIYWIINLVQHQVEVYSDPEGREYRKSQVYSRDQEVPVILDGVEVGKIRAAVLLP